MNTMYRNQEAGYQQVKKTFSNTEERNKIIKEEDIGPARRNKLLEEIGYIEKKEPDCKIYENSDEYKKAEEKLKRKLSEAVEDVNKEKLYNEWPKKLSSIRNKFSVLSQMPKALLHVHSTAGLSVEGLENLIIEWNKDHPDNDKLQICYTDVLEAVDNVLLYQVQAKKLYDEKIIQKYYPVGTAGLPENLKASLYMQRQNSDIKENWKNFTDVFSRTVHLFTDANFYGKYHEHFFNECLKDNIKYVELRTGFQEFRDWNKEEEIKKSIIFLRQGFSMKDFFHHYDMMVSATPNDPNREFLIKILEAKNEVNKNKDEKEKLKVKVILTANRNKATDLIETFKKVDAAIAMKNRIGNDSGEKEIEKNKYWNNIADMIIGFDFVNQEFSDSGLTEDLHKKMYEMFYADGTDSGNPPSVWNELVKHPRINLMRFFLHDGESTERIEAISSNAITGPICSRHRLGHGFQMGTDDNFDELGKDIRHYILNGCEESRPEYLYNGSKYERRDYIIEPVLELCPISNYMLHYVEDLSKHPVISLMEAGMLAVICNDDPQIFNSKGLTDDYAMMYLAILEHLGVEKAYEYLKLSAFLGFFYQEMSQRYYIPRGMFVNDAMRYTDEIGIFEKAVETFKVAWKQFTDEIPDEQSNRSEENL